MPRKKKTEETKMNETPVAINGEESLDDALEKSLKEAGLDEVTRNYVRCHLDLPEAVGVREARNEKQLERVRMQRTWLSVHLPFLGYLVLQLKLVMTEIRHRVPTAAITWTGTAYFNSRFVENLSDEELRGLLCHEVLHAAFEVHARAGLRDPNTWNRAHDYVVNEIIEKMANGKKMKLPPGGLRESAYDDKAAEEIYDILCSKSEESGSGNGKGSSSRADDGSDSSGDKDYNSGGCAGGGSDGKRPELGSDVRSDLESTEEGRKASAGDAHSRASIARSWKEKLLAAEQLHGHGSGQGSLPGALKRVLDEIKDPRVPWQEMLSRWVGENGKRRDTTYTRRSRRSDSVPNDIVLPGQKKMGFPDVTILWDTSGSMTGTENEILGEVAEIMEGLGLTVRLIICDCTIHADQSGLDEVDKLFDLVSGGGGSSFSPAFERLHEEGNNSVVVAFTDGYIDVPPAVPPDLAGVLWVITEGGQRPCSWGDALRIDDKGFAKLI